MEVTVVLEAVQMPSALIDPGHSSVDRALRVPLLVTTNAIHLRHIDARLFPCAFRLAGTWRMSSRNHVLRAEGH
jgi:hypothetical protein